MNDVTTLVLTSTLTGLAADSRLGAARGQGRVRRAASFALLISGAVAGVALCRVGEGLAVAVAVAAFVVLAVTGIGHGTDTTAPTSAQDVSGQCLIPATNEPII